MLYRAHECAIDEYYFAPLKGGELSMEKIRLELVFESEDEIRRLERELKVQMGARSTPTVGRAGP